MNTVYYWYTKDATTESRDAFDAQLAGLQQKIEKEAELEELKEKAQAEGRELTTREKLLRARPDWGSLERVSMESMAAAAQMSSYKTKAQHQAEVNEQRRLAGIRSTEVQEAIPDE